MKKYNIEINWGIEWMVANDEPIEAMDLWDVTQNMDYEFEMGLTHCYKRYGDVEMLEAIPDAQCRIININNPDEAYYFEGDGEDHII